MSLAGSPLPFSLSYEGQLWERQLGWDDQVPEVLRERHTKWREELPMLASIKARPHYS